MRALTGAPKSDWDAALEERLDALEEEDLLRRLRPVERAGPLVYRDGSRLLNLSSNDYLGLARHPTLVEALRRAAERGVGATASRLVVGSDPEVAALEEKLAAFAGAEAALVFGSGYAANVGALSALLGREDAVFSDRLNHASIWDGIKLSGAALFRYRHLDLDHLESLLEEADRTGARRKLIVTDSVFSMDGDVAPLRELVELKERYGAALVVDDAHGGGVFGPRGEGYAFEVGVADDLDLVIGTFSKAFGVYGAYVAGRASWIRYLVNRSRTFVYTTGLPPPIIGAISASLDVVAEAGDARRALRDKAERFRTALSEHGLDTCGSATQIVPLLVGESAAALDLSRALEERGVLAVAIRPPTVPPGTARLRFSLMATHDDGELERAVEVLAEAARAVGAATPAPTSRPG
jgi:8-amino-7-oxononanoate synthase